MRKRAIFFISLCIAAGIMVGCGAEGEGGYEISSETSDETTEEEVEEETEESDEEASEEASEVTLSNDVTIFDSNELVSASDETNNSGSNNANTVPSGGSAANTASEKNAAPASGKAVTNTAPATQASTTPAAQANTAPAAQTNPAPANTTPANPAPAAPSNPAPAAPSNPAPATQSNPAPANTTQANANTQNAAPAKVLPVAPTVKDGVHIFTGKGVETCFEWNKPENTTAFQVIVEARDRNASNSTPFTTITKFTTIDLDYRFGDYQNYDVRIKVRACNGPCSEGAYGPWSEYAYGNTHTDVLACPKMNTTVVNPCGDDGTYYISFSWQPVIGADSYKIDISRKARDASEFTLFETRYSDECSYNHRVAENYDVQITVSARMYLYDASGNRKIVTGPAVSTIARAYEQ